MKLSFHPAAESEFDLAINYYEDCEPGLGNDFSLEVLTGIQAIADYPRGWPVIEGDVRLTSRPQTLEKKKKITQIKRI